jgi:hypothetical protein
MRVMLLSFLRRTTVYSHMLMYAKNRLDSQMNPCQGSYAEENTYM